MLSLKVLLWGIAYTSGIARLSLSVIIMIKERKKVYIWDTAFQLVLAVLIISLTNMEVAIMLGRNSVKIFGILATYSSALIVMVLPVYMHYLSEIKPKRLKRLNKIFILTSLYLCVMLLIMDLGFFQNIRLIFFKVTIALMAASMIYANVLRIFHNKKAQKPRLSIRILTTFVIALVPLLIWFDFLNNNIAGFIITPVFYIFVNILMFLTDHGSLTAPETALELSEETAERFGLTKREREVAVLLTDGLTYQDIADQLFISLQTVKTHANRIYSKTGSRNKMELRKALR